MAGGCIVSTSEMDNKMKLLLVEDDITLADLVKKKLKLEGFAVDSVTLGEEGVHEATTGSYDCVVLDVNLPDVNGFDVCKRIREKNSQIPILMLTARNVLEDRVTGLNIGADDYVAKPVDSIELIARIRALIRRTGKQSTSAFKIGDLLIDTSAHLVTRQYKSIELNSKEFSVLEFLAAHAHEVVTRTMIMEHVWGSDFETLSNVVDVYIRYLRTKIDKPGLKPLIHTIRGHGYVLSDKR